MQNNLIFCSFNSPSSTARRSSSGINRINFVVAISLLCRILAVAVTAAGIGVTTAAAVAAATNSNSQQCTWDYNSKSIDGDGILCQLKAIDPSTIFDWQPVQDYDKLTIQCSEHILYESELPKNVFTTASATAGVSAAATAGSHQLRNLNELTIDSCKLLRLAGDSLTGLTGLKRLTIRTRNAEWAPSKSLELNVSALHALKELEVLNIIDSNLRHIPEGAFCELHTLQVLNVTRNRIRSTDNLGFSQKPCGSGGGGGGEGDLRVLDMSHNELLTLPENWSFTKLRRLQQLNLEHNNITEISGESLAGLPSLRVFNISYNKLESLPNGLFAGARDFQEIHLQHNRLYDIPRGLFHKLEQLLILDLSGNQLSSHHIDNGTFAGLVRLIVLNLAHNALTRIDAKTFRELFFLQILDLHNNSIGYIDDNTFLPLYNLHTLNLAENRLHTINNDMFNGLFVLSKLTVNNNLISNIEPFAFRNCSDLKELDLSTNQLQDVPQAIRNLSMLRTLDIGENQIIEIQIGAFANLNQLTGLRLIDNQIGNITKDLFIDLPRLSVLNLAKNRIQLIERGSFDANNEIEALRLDRNFISDINGVFATMNSLLWLNLAENHLVWFDYAFIPRSLKWLDLKSNYIEELGNYYKLQEEISLKTLDASHNRLNEIGPMAVPNSIELLFINDNMINSIQPNTFIDKVNLTRVDLYSNALKKIHLHTLRLAPIPSSRSLPEFYLGGNPFYCDCSMDWLSSVNDLTARQHPRVMDLANIECVMPHEGRGAAVRTIPTLSARDFLCKYETMCFALCHCCDFDACDCEMICPTNCTCYHDQTWNTNVVDCGGGSGGKGGSGTNGAGQSLITTLPKKVPMDTTVLYFDGNVINELQNNAFIGRKNLQQLYLNNSGLHRLQKRALAGLHSLEILHLEQNQLRTLHGHEFDNLNQLKELYLQNNQLDYIANETFVSLKALQLLRIDGNRLVTLTMFQMLTQSSVVSQHQHRQQQQQHQQQYAQHFPNMKSLSIGRNFWSCRCAFLQELTVFVSDNAVILEDAQDIYCVEGGTKRELDFNSTSDCSSSFYEGRSVLLPDIRINEHIPLLMTAIILLIFVGMLVLAIVFRDPLRIWLFAKCGVRMCETIGEDYEKLYDAVFLYSEKDYEMLTRDIATDLEIRPPQLRLCLQHRDLIHDATYLQILESARASKRVVIFLSRNFLQTEWSRYEVRNAVHEALREKGPQKLVLLEENSAVIEAESDLELLPYMKSRVVNAIKLSDKQFWQKLRYALPAEVQQQRCNNYTLHHHQNHPQQQQQQRHLHSTLEYIPKSSSSAINAESICLQQQQQQQQQQYHTHHGKSTGPHHQTMHLHHTLNSNMHAGVPLQQPSPFYQQQQENDEANYSSATTATPSPLGRRATCMDSNGDDQSQHYPMHSQNQHHHQRPPSEHIYFSIESDYNSTNAGNEFMNSSGGGGGSGTSAGQSNIAAMQQNSIHRPNMTAQQWRLASTHKNSSSPQPHMV